MTVLPLPREEKYKNPLFGSERNPGIKHITNRMGGASSDISAKCAACMLRFYQKDSKINLKSIADAIRHEPNKKRRHNMTVKTFDELVAKVKSGKKSTVALVCANDAHALEAVIHASDLVDAVLVVEADKLDELKALLVSLGKNPDDFAIEVVPEGMHPSVCAAKLIHAGKADFLMKGKIMTGNLLKGVLSPDADLRTGSLMSHVMLFEVPGYHKLLGVTDGGMCTYPDLEKKVGIVKNAVRFFHKIGVEKPNVAALCAIETINPKMQETVDGAELKRMSLAGELGECYVEGPISYDLAMVPELSAVKGYTACPCCGDFDILLVPEIVVGNVLGKCLTYTCGGRMAGIVMGCKVPIVLTSRGSSAEEKYYSLAMGAGFVG